MMLVPSVIASVTRSSSDDSTLWLQLRRTARGGRPASVEFRFAPELLRALALQPAKPRVRSAAPALEPEILVLTDTIPYDGATMFIRAWLIRSPHLPEHYHLRVELTAPRRLSRDTELELDWGNHRYTLPLRAGVALFEDITLPSYSARYGNLPSKRYRLRLRMSPNGKH